MSKIFSIVLSVSAILVSIFFFVLSENDSKYDGVISFFCGVLFGIGIATLLKVLFTKKL